MNKAQRDLMFKTGDMLFHLDEVDDVEYFRQSVWEFAVKFAEIDPTPDTKKYVVRLAGGSNNDHATVNGVQYETKELAAQHIKRFVRDHMFEGSCKILSYNGQLEEVRYSMYEGGIVYKRWVEEVE